MKKRLLSLALALALCLGLTVPALAADASGLDAKTASAYLQVLKAQVDKYGVQNGADKTGISYAGLQDMDGDGVSELVIISLIETGIFGDVDFGIWKMRNGNAVRTVDEELNYGALFEMKNLTVAFAHKGGQTRLFYQWDNEFLGSSIDGERMYYRNRSYVFFTADGTADIQEFSDGADGNHRYEFANYDRSWQVDTTPLLSFDGTQWTYSSKSVSELQAALTAKANEAPSKPTTTTPAPGTFGPYSIYVDGWAKYFIDFESAKVERKTVKVRTVGMDGELGDYENVDAILIKVAPLSRVSTRLIDDPDGAYADFARYAGCDGAYGWSADVDGSDKFTVYARGSAEFWLYSGAIERSITGKDECIDLDWTMDSAGNYVQAFVLLESGTGTTAPSEPTAPSFTDVPAGEYYAAPVSWAISKGITNGTSVTTFSPGENCTEAQILTFLWRASGKPAPSGQRPAWVDAAYQDAVLWASNKGMIDLAGFNPGKPCTRASAVKFIWQAQGSPSPSAASAFTDVDKGAGYAAAVSWAVEKNVTKGTSTTTFSPNDTCTRGQIVTFLHRAMG